MATRLEHIDKPSRHHLIAARGETMYRSELEIRVRYEELRREADRQRLIRQAVEGHAAAGSGQHEPEGRVSAKRGRWARVRRAHA
ncbi:hypothetical protein [Streptomyces sp. NPDC048650]|uniref:hypothetical protein n=1 Tax=unclassified Streptomyces TaxID=2593676 RepID=UPI00370F7F48